MKRSIGLIVVYVAGLIGLAWWSLTGLFGGAPKEDWALMIVLPLAWLFSFWPIVGSLLLALKWRGLMKSLDTVDARLRSGESVRPDTRTEVVDALVDLAARENGVPRFVARRFIEKVVDRSIAKNDSNPNR